MSRISQKCGLCLRNDLHPGDVGVYLGLLPYKPCITHSKAVKEVHQDNNDEEHEGKEEEITERRVERNVRKFQLSNKHGEGLDKSETNIVKERIIFFYSIVIVQEDVEAKTEGDDEEGVPGQEGDECFQNPVEHCRIDIIRG